MKGVYQETKGQQQPWISSSFFGEFVFKPQGSRPALTAAPAWPAIVAPLAPVQQAAVTSQARAAAGYQQQTLDLGGLYLVEGTNPNGSRYRGMVALTQAGNQYRFTWWIQRQVFSGVGQFAGRTLVVNWGAKSPVIYNVASNATVRRMGRLQRRREARSVRAAPPAARCARPEAATASTASTPTSAATAARVNITRIADHYRFDCKVGTQSYHGDRHHERQRAGGELGQRHAGDLCDRR